MSIDGVEWILDLDALMPCLVVEHHKHGILFYGDLNLFYGSSEEIVALSDCGIVRAKRKLTLAPETIA